MDGRPIWCGVRIDNADGLYCTRIADHGGAHIATLADTQPEYCAVCCADVMGLTDEEIVEHQRVDVERGIEREARGALHLQIICAAAFLVAALIGVFLIAGCYVPYYVGPHYDFDHRHHHEFHGGDR